MFSALRQWGTPRVLVVGDVMLDRYTWCGVERVSPEAPVLVLEVERDEARLGGAASVARLLRGLEAKVAVAAALGDDPAGESLRDLLAAENIDSKLLLTVPGRITSVKERFLGKAGGRGGSQIVRVDRERPESIAAAIEDRLIDGVRRRITEFSAVLISDYGKGVCTARFLQAVMAAATGANVPVLVDPAAGRELSAYRGARIVVPNRREAELVLGRSIRTLDEALAASEDLRERHALPAILLKLDQDGMVLATDGTQPGHFPTAPRAVCDVTGAGDMVLAVAGICVAAGIPLAVAAGMANIAAGLEVEHLGVVPVTRDRLQVELQRHGQPAPGKIVTIEQLTEIRAQLTASGKSLVLTNGCFDLLHAGHVSYLREAARLGDVLAVAINSDRSVRRLKGADRPIVGQADRAELLAALECIDYVTIFDDLAPYELLGRVRPDVLVKGGTYSVDEVVGAEVVREYGGRICVTGCLPGISTTRIVNSVRAAGRLAESDAPCLAAAEA